MSKPIIAVVPLWDDDKNSIWMLPGYLDGIREAGGIPIILPLEASEEDYLRIFSLCSGLLMTGGHDVSPALYGEDAKDTCGVPCEARDMMEKLLYENALATGKPVLGICRGIQLINVLQGGTLYQDLPSEYNSTVNHHMNPPYTDIAHYVNIKAGTPLHDLLGEDRIGVNSYHHQALKTPGKDLEVMAVSEDGLPEAVRHTKSPFVWAFQWHPELDFHVNPRSKKIFEKFVEMAIKSGDNSEKTAIKSGDKDEKPEIADEKPEIGTKKRK